MIIHKRKAYTRKDGTRVKSTIVGDRKFKTGQEFKISGITYHKLKTKNQIGKRVSSKPEYFNKLVSSKSFKDYTGLAAVTGNNTVKLLIPSSKIDILDGISDYLGAGELVKVGKGIYAWSSSSLKVLHVSK